MSAEPSFTRLRDQLLIAIAGVAGLSTVALVSGLTADDPTTIRLSCLAAGLGYGACVIALVLWYVSRPRSIYPPEDDEDDDLDLDVTDRGYP